MREIACAPCVSQLRSKRRCPPGVPWSRLLWAYVVIQLIVSIPFVGCIGLAEGSMTLALICIGVRPAPALAVVLVYRLVSFWLTLPLGWFASRYLARAESAQSPVRIRL